MERYNEAFGEVRPVDDGSVDGVVTVRRQLLYTRVLQRFPELSLLSVEHDAEVCQRETGEEVPDKRALLGPSRNNDLVFVRLKRGFRVACALISKVSSSADFWRKQGEIDDYDRKHLPRLDLTPLCRVLNRARRNRIQELQKRDDSFFALMQGEKPVSQHNDENRDDSSKQSDSCIEWRVLPQRDSHEALLLLAPPHVSGTFATVSGTFATVSKSKFGDMRALDAKARVLSRDEVLAIVVSFLKFAGTTGEYKAKHPRELPELLEVDASNWTVSETSFMRALDLPANASVRSTLLRLVLTVPLVALLVAAAAFLLGASPLVVALAAGVATQLTVMLMACLLLRDPNGQHIRAATAPFAAQPATGHQKLD
ncbi:MAG: hypothetical protein MHM6MM_003625 [Cercozoa sp. M6MM]